MNNCDTLEKANSNEYGEFASTNWHLPDLYYLITIFIKTLLGAGSIIYLINGEITFSIFLMFSMFVVDALYRIKNNLKDNR